MTISVDMSRQIIDRAWAKAEASAAALDTRLDAAQTAVSGSTSMGGATVDPITSIAAPSVLIPLEAAGPDLVIFDQYNTAIFNKMVAALSGYLTDYFPMSDATAGATEAWLQAAMAGGTGVNTGVEQQIFERERSRITAEMNRAIDDVESTWSAKRFPMPPGALAAQVLRIQ